MDAFRQLLPPKTNIYAAYVTLDTERNPVIDTTRVFVRGMSVSVVVDVTKHTVTVHSKSGDITENSVTKFDTLEQCAAFVILLLDKYALVWQ